MARNPLPVAETLAEPQASARWHRLALLALLLLGLALRLWRITDQSIWFDEGWSLHVAQQTPSEALRLLGSEGHTHPPGYYLLLWGWLRVWGTSVLAARGLSVTLGVISIWLTYRIGTRLADRATGLLAAALVAFNPAHLVYSQEARMYTMLMAALALLWLQYLRIDQRPDGGTWVDWGLIALIETVAIYTHFFAAFAIAAMVAWTVPRLLLSDVRRDWNQMARWAASQFLVFLAFLPWLRPALARASTHATLDTVPPTVASFARETWAFVMGGHIALLGREPAFATAAWAALAVIGLVFLALLAMNETRLKGAYLVVQTLMPLLLLLALMRLRPGYHPRYALMIMPPMMVALALGMNALARVWRQLGRVSAAVLLLVVLTPQGLAYEALSSDTYYRRDDAAATVARLDDALAPGDPVLLDVDDWALKYYLGQTDLTVATVNASQQPEAVTAQVASHLAGHDQVALIAWYQGTTDMRGLLPYILAQRGRMTAQVAEAGYTVMIYGLDDAPSAQAVRETDIDFGPIDLASVASDTDVPADEALAVSLAWEVQEPLPADLKLALQLVDHKEHTVASRDVLLRNAEGERSHDWDTGAVVHSFHRLSPPSGLAPGTYTLQAGLYQQAQIEGLDVLDEAGAPAGKQAQLVEVDLAPAAMVAGETDALAPGLKVVEGDASVAPGLELVGYALSESAVDTGETLEVALLWRAEHALADHVIGLALSDEGEILVSDEQRPAYGQYPTSAWRPGELVRSYRELIIPPDLESGEATLQVQVADHEPVVLTQVGVTAVPRSFARPAPAFPMDRPLGGFARLIGYDLPRTEIASGEPLSLTLYWEAKGTSKVAYVVFCHLLDADGRLIAQHDSPPRHGERPTTGWIAGEFLTDEHELAWVVDGSPGVASVEVGLYDPITGQRVLLNDGASRILLPTPVDIR